MMKNLLVLGLASAALIPASAAAQVLSGLPGGNPGQGGGGASLPGPATNSGPGGFGAFSKGDMSNMESDICNNDRLNAQGTSTSAASRLRRTGAISADSKRALDQMYPDTRATTSVRGGAFAGLTTGMALTSNGAEVGSVQQIRTKGDGSVAVVIVESANGHFFGVPAEKLTLNAGVLSTTMRLVGVNADTSTAMGAPSH